MRSQRRMIGLVVPLAVLAGAVVVSDLLGATPTPVPPASGGAAGARGLAPGSIRSAEEEGPAPSSLPKYRLPHQALLGLPTGIQLSARPGDEATLAAVGAALERALRP